MKNWLPIRKDYLIDNFESLLTSLAEADYQDSQDGFLTETIEKLEEVAVDLLTNDFSHRLGVTNTDNPNFDRDLKIVCTAIYALENKNRKTSRLLGMLFDTLIINGMYREEGSVHKLHHICLNLAREASIQSLQYNLKDLMVEDFNSSLFAQRLLNITFLEADQIPVGYESKGSCVIESDNIDINPVGFSELDDTKLKTVTELSLGISLKSKERMRLSDMDFKDQVRLLNRLTQSVSDTVPKPRIIYKNYEPGDTFFVEVIEINDVREWVKCRTLDPAYAPLELYLDLRPVVTLNRSFSISRKDIVDYLQVGDKLKVSLELKENNKRFGIEKTFRTYYDTESNFTDIYEALFLEKYDGGTRWLTDVGHIVNIKNQNWDQEIEEAAKQNCSVTIQINYLNKVMDSNGHYVLNAKRVGSLQNGRDHAEVRQEIAGNLIDGLLGYWDAECPLYRAERVRIRSIDPIYVKLLCHLLATLAGSDADEHFTRYLDMIGARILATMLEDEHDEVYCEFYLAYLRALWAFAQDYGHEWLSSLSSPESIATLPAVVEMERIVEILGRYKDSHIVSHTAPGNEIDIDRLEHLVDASNALSGNIALSEINRIKRTITRCLGIESIYKERASEKYWFGDESEMLEFKTSIVYPPSKSADRLPNPNFQIWAILKTINGFLNSLYGGTLLIGVNDFGNASGVDDDIRWLFQNNQLLTPNADRYIQYIKLRVDNAYEAYKRNDSGRDITSTRVRYSSIPIEGKTVVRIDIMPYELGCVKMKRDLQVPGSLSIGRPEVFREAYIRNAATTEELTDAIRKKLEREKRSVIKESEQRKHIVVQEAIEAGKMIELKAYQSASETADRVLTPVELLPLRGLIVGMKPGQKTLQVFKLSRCADVVLLERDADKTPARLSYSVDPFNMLASGGKGSIELRLKLDRLGELLLKEMYPFAIQFVKETGDATYPYRLECRISDVRGVGSFCMSIPGHFEIEDTPKLKEHIKEACAKLAEKV